MFYLRKNAYFFGFIPAGAGGHFNVDIKHIKARLYEMLRSKKPCFGREVQNELVVSDRT